MRVTPTELSTRALRNISNLTRRVNMSQCFIVIHRNYADGLDACVFWNEDEAKKSVNEDVDTVVKSLTAVLGTVRSSKTK